MLGVEDQKRNFIEREAYAKFLQKFQWDDFITVTFRQPRKEPYYAMQSVWHTLQRGCGVHRFFAGCEPHQSGDLHIHGLVSGWGTGDKGYSPAGVFHSEEADLPWNIFDTLFKVYGRCKVEACNSQERVTAYCAKYILKQQSRVGDFYEFFGEKEAWHNGRIDRIERLVYSSGVTWN